MLNVKCLMLSSRQMLSYYTVFSTSQRNLHSHHPLEFPIWLTTNSKCWKREKTKGFTISSFPIVLYFSLLIMWKDLRELIVVLDESSLLFNRITRKESVFSNNTSTCFKFIMTSARAKNLWPPTQKWKED